MIETRVRVLHTSDGLSFVEATEHNGCGACGHQEGCAVSGLGRFLGRRRRPIAIACGAVRPGQEVRVAVAEADLLKVGLWAYLSPTLLAVAGAAALSGQGDAAAVGGAVAGLAAGLLIARRFAAQPCLSITPGA